MTDYEIIKNALEIAQMAHKGQKDKAGKEYFYHPVTVALLCDDVKARAVALLHDTLEDAPDRVTYEMLTEKVGREVADAVLLLTNREDGPYLDYVKNIANSGNPLAIAVKKADLTMNMDLSRLENPTEADFRRIETKYKPAMEILETLVK